MGKVSSEALMISTKQYERYLMVRHVHQRATILVMSLLAIEIPDEKIENSVRMSWGAGVEKEDVCEGFGEVLNTVKKLGL